MDKTTKPSREEVLRIASACGIRYTSTGDLLNPNLERFAAAMYAKGAEDMRERAAINHEVLFNDALGSAAIRALPITPTNTEGEQ